MKREVKFYNVLFPLWFVMLIPQVWFIILPGNFVIDSIVLLVTAFILRLENKKQWYKGHIVKVFAVGMLSDIIGAAYMLFVLGVLEIGSMGDEPYLTIPALIISAVLIFVLNYFITFKKDDKRTGLCFSLVFAIVTAPYTFLIPSSWM